MQEDRQIDVQAIKILLGPHAHTCCWRTIYANTCISIQLTEQRTR